MIAITYDQKRFSGEFPTQPLQKTPIVVRCHFLTANIFIDRWIIAGIAPVGRQLGTQALVPREMIGHRVNVKEERSANALTFDNLNSLIEIKTIGLEVARAKVDHVQIARDPCSLLESPRAQKSSIERIQAEGLIAAAAQGVWQSTGDAPGGDSGHRCRETPIRESR